MVNDKASLSQESNTRGEDVDFKTIKAEQNELRERLVQICIDQELSIFKLAIMLKIPYATMRRFMMGTGLHYANLIKVHKFLNP